MRTTVCVVVCFAALLAGCDDKETKIGLKKLDVEMKLEMEDRRLEAQKEMAKALNASKERIKEIEARKDVETSEKLWATVRFVSPFFLIAAVIALAWYFYLRQQAGIAHRRAEADETMSRHRTILAAIDKIPEAERKALIERLTTDGGPLALPNPAA